MVCTRHGIRTPGSGSQVCSKITEGMLGHLASVSPSGNNGLTLVLGRPDEMFKHFVKSKSSQKPKTPTLWPDLLEEVFLLFDVFYLCRHSTVVISWNSGSPFTSRVAWGRFFLGLCLSVNGGDSTTCLTGVPSFPILTLPSRFLPSLFSIISANMLSSSSLKGRRQYQFLSA